MNGFRAAPILPARDLAETVAFYRALGFRRYGNAYENYLMMMDNWELHFFPHPDLVVEDSFAAAYLRCSDIVMLDAEWAAVELPADGIPRMIRAEQKAWGVKELAIIDPNGTLLRVGEEK